MKPTQFGNYLKKIRKEKGLTLVQLSKLSGVSNPYISQLENGHFKPSLEVIQKLSKGLGLDESVLFYAAGYVFDVNFDQDKEHSIVSELSQEQRDDENNNNNNDLFSLLLSDVDLYFKNKLLSENDKEKILTIISTILDK